MHESGTGGELGPPLSDGSDRVSTMRFPTAFTILFVLIAVVAALTWIINAGQYQRAHNEAPHAENRLKPGAQNLSHSAHIELCGGQGTCCLGRKPSIKAVKQ